jgi:hypothetical protein
MRPAASLLGKGRRSQPVAACLWIVLEDAEGSLIPAAWASATDRARSQIAAPESLPLSGMSSSPMRSTRDFRAWKRIRSWVGILVSTCDSSAQASGHRRVSSKGSSRIKLDW